MKEKTIWNLEYCSVMIEIIKWGCSGHEPTWNYYLHIPVEQLPDKKTFKLFNLKPSKYRYSPEGKEYITFPYMSAPLISDLDWHCGITYYEKIFNGFGQLSGFQLGCDYAHLWDENRSFSIEYVTHDAKRSVDRLYELVPNLKQRSHYDGKYNPTKEGCWLPDWKVIFKEYFSFRRLLNET